MKDIYLITASFVGEITRDFDNYMRMTKKAGYKGIEMYKCPYDQYSGKELRKLIESYGLTAISCHVDTAESDKMIAYLPDTGVQFMVNPGLRVQSRDDAFRGAETLNEIGKKCKEAGLRYGYHNHNNDFDVYDGKSVIDIFMENTDPDYVTFEIDAAWAWRAGVNAAQFITDHAGRVDLVHVKETARVLGPEDDLSHLFKNQTRLMKVIAIIVLIWLSGKAVDLFTIEDISMMRDNGGYLFVRNGLIISAINFVWSAIYFAFSQFVFTKKLNLE